MSKTVEPRNQKLRTLGLFLVPVVLLAAIIALFLRTGGGLNFKSPAPIEELNFERVIIVREPMREFELMVRNASQGNLTVAQVVINDAVRPFTMTPSTTIPRLGTARITIPYGWVEGESYAIRLFSSNSIPFDTEIAAAFETPQTSGATLLGFTLIGLYVGVIPIFLGIFWLPALRKLSRVWMTFLTAVTAGLLIFLGIDTLVEGLEQANRVAGPFQGVGLLGIGAVSIFLLLAAISNRQGSIGRSESQRRLAVAYMIALGIGLHNLGEGLAIGAAYNVGAATLGTFLVVGFIIQNITEGLGIIAPILRDRTPMKDLAVLGVLGGGPAILGTWLGGFSPSPILAVLFFGIGTGAIFEVVYEIAKLLQRDLEKRPAPMVVFSGIVSGMLLLWVTGLLVK
jgi:zinc transporter ZupT